MRLLRTPSPYSDESLMGYLLRLTEANFYPSSLWIFKNLDWKVNLITGGWRRLISYWDFRNDFCQLVGKTDSELACLELRNAGYGTVDLFDQQISNHYIQFHNSRFCPECLSETNYHRKIWDLIFITACPFHKKLLVDTCPRCKNKIYWNRNKVGLCICGFELKYAEAESVTLSDLKHNLILFEMFNIDTPYNLDLLIKRNPLRKIPSELYIDFIVSLMYFLRDKKSNDRFSQTTSNVLWHSYSLKALNYFENYPHNIAGLFKKAGTAFNFETCNPFINAIFNCSSNSYLFFILIAFSEYENKTYNYPKFEVAHSIKDDYVNLNHVIENLRIDKNILLVLYRKGLVISFKEYLGFYEHERYISRKSLDEISEKIKSNIDIYSASELLRLTYRQTIQLIEIGFLSPTKDPYFSDFIDMRFNLDDIEFLIKEFNIPINQPLVEVKNGAVHMNKFKNELASLLDSIAPVDIQNKVFNDVLSKNNSLYPLTINKTGLENYLIHKQNYYIQIEKARLKKAAKFLETKLEQEDKILSGCFDY